MAMAVCQDSGLESESTKPSVETVTSVEPGGQGRVGSQPVAQSACQGLELLIEKSMWLRWFAISDDGRAHIRARLALIPVVCGISVL